MCGEACGCSRACTEAHPQNNRVAAEATVVIVGLDPSMLPWVILVIGIISVTYTTMGGLQAVVMTDLLQFCVLFGGAILTLVVISFRLKGIHWIPLEWSPNWDIQPFFSFDPTVRVTVFGRIGETYELQTSFDLNQWRVSHSFTLRTISETYPVSYFKEGDEKSMFFRVKHKP